jgi:uncharacterized protein (TIGR02594 family)
MVNGHNGRNTVVMGIIEQIWAMFKAVEQVKVKPDPMVDILKVALQEYDVHEFSGTTHNPDVLKYFAECGFETVKDDETSWCSAFICWCTQKAGYEPTNSLVARSWLEWGEVVPSPMLGDVTVLWRSDPHGWQGHVGLFIKLKNNQLWLLGGNQGNKVCIEQYPVKQLLGYRRLAV